MPPKKSSTGWAEAFLLPGMAELAERRKRLGAELARLRSEHAAVARHLAATQKLRDGLLAGHGTPLVEAAAGVLGEVLGGIGLQVVRGDRTDGLVIRQGPAGKAVAAVTVRGPLGQVRQADLRRLLGLLEALAPPSGKPPKGILVANAQRRRDPRARTVAPFDPDVGQAAQAIGLCLLTGVQLFNIACEFRRGALQDPRGLWDDLRATAGAYHKYNDWDQNLRA
jgi:hypothetical protein